MRNQVLIIDDDLNVCKEIKYNLQNELTDVYYAISVSDGLSKLMENEYALVIMDVYLSKTNGMELLQQMRKMRAMPILVLSSKGSTEEKVQALSLGADDYIAKPFPTEECLACSQALMRRFTELNHTQERSYKMVTCDDLVIQKEYHQAFFNGQELKLTRREFEMLELLASHQEQVFTFAQLYEKLWPDEYLDGKNSVVCQVQRLRGKLPQGYIESVRDVGYRMNAASLAWVV